MASRAIFPDFFEEEWTQNHLQFLSGLSRAFFFRQPFSKQLYTKTVDSVFRTLWLATQSVNILHYSLIHLQFLRGSDAKLA